MHPVRRMAVRRACRTTVCDAGSRGGGRGGPSESDGKEGKRRERNQRSAQAKKKQKKKTRAPRLAYIEAARHPVKNAPCGSRRTQSGLRRLPTPGAAAGRTLPCCLKGADERATSGQPRAVRPAVAGAVSRAPEVRPTAGRSRTYVACHDMRLYGQYALVLWHVRHDASLSRRESSMQCCSVVSSNPRFDSRARCCCPCEPG